MNRDRKITCFTRRILLKRQVFVVLPESRLKTVSVCDDQYLGFKRLKEKSPF